MRILLGRLLLAVGSSLSSLEVYCATPFWPAEFMLKKSTDNLMGVPLYIICFFSLAAFNVVVFCFLFFFFVFVSLIPVYLDVFLRGLIYIQHLQELSDHVLPHVREVFSYYLFKYFFRSFLSLSLLSLSLFSFWDSCYWNVGILNVVPEVS